MLSPNIFPLSECSGSTPNKQGHRVKISDILCQNQLSSMSLNLRSTCFGSKRVHCHSVQNLKPDSKVLTWFHHTLSVDIVFLVFGEARIHDCISRWSSSSFRQSHYKLSNLCLTWSLRHFPVIIVSTNDIPTYWTSAIYITPVMILKAFV